MKRRTILRSLGTGLAGAALGAAPGLSRAAYPERPVTLVVPFPPGGSADFFGRQFAAALSQRMQQPVIVDNRVGVGGALGVQMVARSAPDGYTLGMAGAGAMIFMPLLTRKLLFEDGDLTYLSRIVSTPNVLIVGPRVAARDAAELIALAKAKPGSLSLASTGVGSTTHVLAELFKQMAGIDYLHVPFNGSSPAIQAVIGGHVDGFFGDASGVLPQVRAGRVRALLVADDLRAQALPDVPVAEAAGLKGLVMKGSYGFVGPRGLPPALALQLTAMAADALNSPDLAIKFAQQAGVAEPGGAAEYESFVRSERERWLQVIRRAGISLDEIGR
jgi:tripartite-type tricarboxylate transporter receptor subunit TctC